MQALQASESAECAKTHTGAPFRGAECSFTMSPQGSAPSPPTNFWGGPPPDFTLFFHLVSCFILDRIFEGFWRLSGVHFYQNLWATPTAAGPSGDRPFGRLVKEVGQQTCRSADCTQCAQINDRALALQTRSSMQAALEVIIHASRLVHEKRELSCNQSLFSCSVRR